MKLRYILLILLVANPAFAQSDVDGAASTKKFFDFSQYTVIKSGLDNDDMDADVEADVEADGRADATVSDSLSTIERAAIQAAKKRPKINKLRQEREKLFETYSQDKKVIEDEINKVRAALDENKGNFSKTVELNDKLEKLQEQKRQRLSEYKDNNAALLLKMNDIQGRNQFEEEPEIEEPLVVVPKPQKKVLSIREKLKRKQAASSARRRTPSRASASGRGGSGEEKSTSYIKSKPKSKESKAPLRAGKSPSILKKLKKR